jgi:putative DNA primase/helicase
LRIARDYLIPHAQAAFGLMGADARVADARFVLRWLERNSDGRSVSRRDLFNGVRGRFKEVEHLDPVIELLEKRGYLRREKVERHGPGRKPSPVLRLNPLHFLKS